jgi:hypothetical protein
MAGGPPINRVRVRQQDATPCGEHRQRLTEKRAKLEQTDSPAEGERTRPVSTR